MWRSSSRTSAAERRSALSVTLAATTLFTLVVCQWRPWTLFARAGFSGDFYDIQAQAFLRGRLAVPADAAGIEGFLIDGKTYLYYGPLLAIVRLPLALFGSVTEGRLTRLSMIVGFVVLCTVTFHLARRVAVLVGAPSGAPRRPALLIAAVAVSPVLALAGEATVYHETELWAFVLILATFVALADLLVEPSRRSAVLAGAAAMATVLTRVSIGLGAATAVIIVALLIWRRDRRAAVIAVALSFAGLVSHVALNLAKFGTLLDLPADRQVLSLLDPGRAAWFAENGNSFFGLQFLPTTIVHYLRPDAFAVERLAPFVRFGPRAHEFGSSPLESNTPSSSITAAATLLVLIALIGLAMFVRRRQWQLTPMLVGAAVAAIPTLAIGFIANRYLVDLLPALVVLGAVATALFHTGRRSVALGAVSVLVLWGAWANTAMATWLGEIEQPGFISWRYDLDASLFGGVPPSVIRIGDDQPVPRDGVVGIDGPCDGLYISVQGMWVPVELADGVRSVHSIFDPQTGSVVLAVADSGVLTIDVGPTGDTLVTSYVPSTGPPVSGIPVPWQGGKVAVEVVSDPRGGGLTRGLQVVLDGREALRSFDAPDLSAWPERAGFERENVVDGGVSTCAELVRRGA